MLTDGEQDEINRSKDMTKAMTEVMHGRSVNLKMLMWACSYLLSTTILQIEAEMEKHIPMEAIEDICDSLKETTVNYIKVIRNEDRGS